MSILSKIFGKIFPSSQGPAAPAATAAPASPSSPVTPATSTVTAKPMSRVDVEALLDGRAQQSGQKLNWRSSIVDLLKLLDLDSSLAARKELADELHYTGDTHDSATMNIWLHRQVMNKLAQNGGIVPADLRD